MPWRRTLIVGIFLIITGCSKTIPIDDVYGTYVGTYPYGKETLVLKRDNTFLQCVFIKKNSIYRKNQGKWTFDSTISYLTLKNALVVADGFGQLRTDWGKPKEGAVIQPFEKIFFQIVLNSGAEYPLKKKNALTTDCHQ